MKRNELLITVLVSFAFMIGLDQLFEAFAFYYWISNYLSLTVVLNGVLSSFVGVYIAFRTILRIEYKGNLQKGMAFGTIVPILFIIYVSFVVGVYYTVIPFNMWLLNWAFPVFLSSLIGCVIGFLFGGSRLQKMPPPKPRLPATGVAGTEEKFSPLKAGTWMIVFLLVGAVMGYFGGYIIWVLFGQVQLTLGVFPPYAALFPPPPLYAIAWAVVGALSFPFKILPELLKER